MNNKSQDITLIPYRCGAGASTLGCAGGPEFLEKHGVAAHVAEKTGAAVSWFDPQPEAGTLPRYEKPEDAPPLGDPARNEFVGAHVADLKRRVMQAILQDKAPITIGGDHSMAAGSIAGLAAAKDARKKVGVIWVDAHTDINTMQTSPSKALHGMPIASLIHAGGHNHDMLSGDDLDEPVLDPAHICYMGVRDIDAGEKALLRVLPTQNYDMARINEMGVRAAFEQALAYLAPKVDVLMMSFDMDSLDPSEGLATGTKVEGGFRKDELFAVLADIFTQYEFDLLEIAEFNPALKGKRSSEAIIEELLTLYVAAKAGKAGANGAVCAFSNF